MDIDTEPDLADYAKSQGRPGPDIYPFTGGAHEYDRFPQDLVVALSELRNPAADQRADVIHKTGGRHSYQYAALPDILDQVRPVLARHNLALLQSVVQSAPGTVGVLTRLQHASGHSLEFGPLVLPAQGDAQAVGGAITYARRYALCTVLGIAADEDSDGKSAGETTTSPGTALPSTARGQAGTSAAAEAVPASPASSRTSNQPSGIATVAEGRDPGTGGAVEKAASPVPGTPDEAGGPTGQKTGGVGSPASSESENVRAATPEQWMKATNLGLTASAVIKELQAAGIGVSKKSQITFDQLEELIKAARGEGGT